MNADSDEHCGVCGRDISSVPRVNPTFETTRRVTTTKPLRKVNVSALIGFLAALGVTGVGLYLFLSSVTLFQLLEGLLATGVGVTAILIVRDTVENRRYQTGGKLGIVRRGPTRQGGTFRFLRDERSIELKEDREKATGQAD